MKDANEATYLSLLLSDFLKESLVVPENVLPKGNRNEKLVSSMELVIVISMWI